MIFKLEGDGSAHHILACIANSCAVIGMKKEPSSDGFAHFLFKICCDMVMTEDFTLWGAHMAGEKNFFADIMSRDAKG